MLMRAYPVVVDLMFDYLRATQKETFNVADFLVYYCGTTKCWAKCPPIHQIYLDELALQPLDPVRARKDAGLSLGKLFGCICRRSNVIHAKTRTSTYEKALYKKAA